MNATVIPRSRWLHIIPAALVVYSINFMDKVNVGFAAPGIMKDFGAGPAQMGNLMGIFFIGIMASCLVTGYICEVWSAKKWVALSLVGWSLSGIWGGLAQSIDQMYVARFCLGFFEGGVWPAVVFLTGNWFPRAERATAQAMWEISLPIAAMITAPLSGWLVPLVGWRYMLVIECIPPMLWAIAWWYLVEDTPREAKWLPEVERNYIEGKLKEEQLAAKPLPLSVSWKAMIHPFTLHVGFVYFLTIVGTFALTLWAPKVIQDLGATPFQAGLWLMIPNFFTIFFMIFAGRLSDHLQKRKEVVFGVLFMAGLGLLFMGWLGIKSTVLFIVFMTIAMGGIFGRHGPLWAIPRQVLPPGALGMAISSIVMIGNFGGYVGPVLMGYIKGATGSFAGGFYCLAGMLILSSILILFVNEKKPIVFKRQADAEVVEVGRV